MYGIQKIKYGILIHLNKLCKKCKFYIQETVPQVNIVQQQTSFHWVRINSSIRVGFKSIILQTAVTFFQQKSFLTTYSGRKCNIETKNVGKASEKLSKEQEHRCYSYKKSNFGKVSGSKDSWCNCLTIR